MGDRRAADEASFTAFVVARQAALLRAAYLLTGDDAAAEDLVQAALAEAALRWRRLHDGSPEAYVRRVIYTRFVSGWRRRRVVREEPVQDLPERAGPDHAATTDTRLALRRALAELAPRQRACVVLRYFEDRSEAETAALLGCSVGTVKSQTYDALRRLRELAPELAPGMQADAPDLPAAEVSP